MANNFEKELETPEMETLAGLAENLVYRLPGCSDAMLRKTIQEVYRDFCRRSCCLRVRRQFRLAPGERRYVAAPIFGGMVDSVAFVTANGRFLAQGHDYDVSGPVVHFAKWVSVPPDADEMSAPSIDISYIEIPKIGQESAPQWLIDRYGDAICSGAIAKLTSMTGRPWTDVAQAQAETVRYENFIGEARLGYYSGSVSGSGDAGPAFDASDMI